MLKFSLPTPSIFLASIVPGFKEPSALPTFTVSSASPLIVPMFLPFTKVMFDLVPAGVFEVSTSTPPKSLPSSSVLLPTLILAPLLRSGLYLLISSLSNLPSPEIFLAVCFLP